MKVVRSVTDSNGVPSHQMRTGGSHSSSGKEEDGKKERKRKKRRRGRVGKLQNQCK